MTDLSKTIDPESNQLTADDLISGDRTIKITDVRGIDGNRVSIHFEGDNGKPWIPCKTMRRVLVYVWGKDGKSYSGRSLRIYRDPSVKYGGIEVGGIRISHMSHTDTVHHLSLTETRGKKAPFEVRPLKTAQPKPEKPRGDIEQARQLLSTADELTVGAIRKGLAEQSWTKEEGAEIKQLIEEASARKRESADLDRGDNPDNY